MIASEFNYEKYNDYLEKQLYLSHTAYNKTLNDLSLIRINASLIKVKDFPFFTLEHFLTCLKAVDLNYNLIKLKELREVIKHEIGLNSCGKGLFVYSFIENINIPLIDNCLRN